MSEENMLEILQHLQEAVEPFEMDPVLKGSTKAILNSTKQLSRDLREARIDLESAQHRVGVLERGTRFYLKAVAENELPKFPEDSEVRKILRQIQMARLGSFRRKLAVFVQAMEHATKEERAEYLKEHPKADPKDHTVAKGQKALPIRNEEKKHVRDVLYRAISDHLAKAMPSYAKWDEGRRKRARSLVGVSIEMATKALTAKGRKEVLKVDNSAQDLLKKADGDQRSQMEETMKAARELMLKGLEKLGGREYDQGEYISKEDAKKLADAFASKAVVHVWG